MVVGKQKKKSPHVLVHPNFAINGGASLTMIKVGASSFGGGKRDFLHAVELR